MSVAAFLILLLTEGKTLRALALPRSDLEKVFSFLSLSTEPDPAGSVQCEASVYQRNPRSVPNIALRTHHYALIKSTGLMCVFMLVLYIITLVGAKVCGNTVHVSLINSQVT